MALQFKIEIEGLDSPSVWRRIIVPETFTFLQLSDAIQLAFGWSGDHEFMFAPKGYGSTPSIGITGNEDKDAEGLLLKDIFKKLKQQYVYIYDFEDDWFHNMILENMSSEKITHADLIEGGGACPPEDCGGIFAYQELLDIVNNPADPEYAETREWLGMEGDEAYDPNEFDFELYREDVRTVEW